jgi:hypothetical protein
MRLTFVISWIEFRLAMEYLEDDAFLKERLEKVSSGTQGALVVTLTFGVDTMPITRHWIKHSYSS